MRYITNVCARCKEVIEGDIYWLKLDLPDDYQKTFDLCPVCIEAIRSNIEDFRPGDVDIDVIVKD